MKLFNLMLPLFMFTWNAIGIHWARCKRKARADKGVAFKLLRRLRFMFCDIWLKKPAAFGVWHARLNPVSLQQPHIIPESPHSRRVPGVLNPRVFQRVYGVPKPRIFLDREPLQSTEDPLKGVSSFAENSRTLCLQTVGAHPPIPPLFLQVQACFVENISSCRGCLKHCLQMGGGVLHPQQPALGLVFSSCKPALCRRSCHVQILSKPVMRALCSQRGEGRPSHPPPLFVQGFS